MASASGIRRIKQILADFGLADGGELHSWRCQQPDIYGECGCVEDLAEAIAKAVS